MQELHESQQNLATLLNNLSGWVYRCRNDKHWTMDYISNGITDLTGYPVEDILNNKITVGEMVHPNDRERVWQAVQDALRKRAHYQIEYRIRTSAGEEKWIWEQGVGVFDDSNQLLHLEGFVTDITERVRVNEQQNLLASVVSQTDDIVLITDKDGVIEYVNPAFERVTGYTADEAIGQNPRLLKSGEHDKDFYNNLWRTIKAGNTFHDVFYNRRKDDSTYYVEQTITPLKNEVGQVVRFVSTGKDITERMQTQEALRASKAQLSNALTIARAGHWEYDVLGDYFIFNDHFYSILRTTAEEMGGYIVRSADYARKFIPDDLKDLLADEIRKAVETDDPNYTSELEHRVIFGDGKTGYLAIRAFAVKDKDGRTIKTYGVNLDITERKKAEQALAEKEQRFTLFMQHYTGVTFIKDTDSHVLFVNNAWLDIFKKKLDEVVGKTDEELWPEDIAQELIKNDRLVIESKSSLQCVEMLPDENGMRQWLVNKFPMFDANGNVQMIGGIAIDVTEEKKKEEQLALLGFALNHVQDGVYLMDENTRFLYVNDQACQSLGYSRDELLGMAVPDIDPVYPMEQQPLHWEQIINQGSLNLETLHRRKDGSTFPVEIRASHFEYGGRDHNLALARDLTEKKKSEEQLALMSFAISHVKEAAYLIDEGSRFLYVNEEACRALGYESEELLKLGVADVDADFPMEQWVKHWREIRSAGSVTLETTHRRKDGTMFPVEVSANYFEYDGKGYNLALVRDITERKQQEQQIEYLAYHDALTNLPNRSLVMDRLEQSLASTQRHGRMMAILYLDLDRFKTINDTLGHPAGDSLLQQVGARLVETVRKDDTVGRLGGDEFLIILQDLASLHDAAHVTEKIHAALADPFRVAEQYLHVTTSIGISLFPRDATDAETLVKYADTALYLAKEEGRNTFRFFSPELDARVHDRLHIENDLRWAVERNELLIHYQPKINLVTGAITGVEALVRWQHPEKGMIPPDEFISIAEEIGLIIPIGEWVLRTSCEQARVWQAAGVENFRICVNLSQRQLEHPEFTVNMANILVETGCDPSLIELEITESSIMHHPEQAIAKLQVLHDMGILLALDDFGTGYSSLGYLKRLPLDRLKIDRTFVSGIPDDANDMAIVQTTIVLARQLGLSVVAEGVETEEQKQFLKELACDEMQGYLFSKPVPVDELEKLLKIQN